MLDERLTARTTVRWPASARQPESFQERMRPTKPTTAAELKVIKWLFGPLLVAAAIWIGYRWVTLQRECTASCKAQGYKGGSMTSTGGTRLTSKMVCECEK
jgi:hypothetical protein